MLADDCGHDRARPGSAISRWTTAIQPASHFESQSTSSAIAIELGVFFSDRVLSIEGSRDSQHLPTAYSTGKAAMPPKRPSSDSPMNGTPRAQKTARGDNLNPEDFSDSVKKRLATSTRTGQACDRCKVLMTRSYAWGNSNVRPG